MDGQDRHLGLRVTRHKEPDLDRLIEWVLNIAEARHRAHVNEEPDPFGLPLPKHIGGRGRIEKQTPARETDDEHTPRH
jgi:hypothetical protein